MDNTLPAGITPHPSTLRVADLPLKGGGQATKECLKERAQ
jgi:hypothetical protein